MLPRSPFSNPLCSRQLSPLGGIVRRTTGKVFASSTFGLFSSLGNKLASFVLATFSSFKTFHPHRTRTRTPSPVCKSYRATRQDVAQEIRETKQQLI